MELIIPIVNETQPLMLLLSGVVFGTMISSVVGRCIVERDIGNIVAAVASDITFHLWRTFFGVI